MEEQEQALQLQNQEKDWTKKAWALGTQVASIAGPAAVTYGVGHLARALGKKKLLPKSI